MPRPWSCEHTPPTLYVGPAAVESAAILRQGDCGVRVAVGDAAGLAEAVRLYLDDRERREEHGRRARAVFEERFTKQRALDAHRRVLESLV